MPTRRVAGQQHRARYARFGANDALVNDPAGYPSAYPAITWLGGGGAGPTDWWQGIDSGGGAVPIGPNGPWAGGGQGQAVVVRATSLIVGPLSAAPYRVVSEGAMGQPVEGSFAWLRDPMRLRPDTRGLSETSKAVIDLMTESITTAALTLTRSAFWAGYVRSSLHYGLGAFIWLPDIDGAPLAGTLKLIDPRCLTTVAGPNEQPLWAIDFGDGAPWVFDDTGTYGSAIPWRITVLRNPLSDVDAEGMSLGVFAMSPEAFRLGTQIGSYMSGTFRSGVPAGYLKVETPGLAQEDATALKTAWLAAHGGDRRSIAVLNATTSFTPLTFSPVDAAIGESKRLSIADVAFAFGMDPVTLNVSLANSATYNNVRDAWVNHRDYALSPWVTALQDTLSALLPGSNGVLVSLDSFAQPSLRERVTTGKLAVDAGLITVDEWRHSEGLPPLPKPQVPAQLQLVTDEPDEPVDDEPPAIEPRARPPALRR